MLEFKFPGYLNKLRGLFHFLLERLRLRLLNDFRITEQERLETVLRTLYWERPTCPSQAIVLGFGL